MILRLVSLVVIALATGTALWLVSRSRGGHAAPSRVDPGPLALPDAQASTVVFFGHVDCLTCPDTLAAVQAVLLSLPDVRLRVVEYAEEPTLFQHFEINSVPTMLLLSARGDVLWARAGHPRGEELVRALARA